jgi:hypothetical protein
LDFTSEKRAFARRAKTAIATLFEGYSDKKLIIGVVEAVIAKMSPEVMATQWRNFLRGNSCAGLRKRAFYEQPRSRKMMRRIGKGIPMSQRRSSGTRPLIEGGRGMVIKLVTQG